MANYAAVAIITMLGIGATLPGRAEQSVQRRPATVMVLDMSGSGVKLTTVGDGVLFDMDGTGVRQPIAWMADKSDNALLAMDLNNNGLVDSAAELVGTRLGIPGGGAITSGADVLMMQLQGKLGGIGGVAEE